MRWSDFRRDRLFPVVSRDLPRGGRAFTSRGRFSHLRAQARERLLPCFSSGLCRGEPMVRNFECRAPVSGLQFVPPAAWVGPGADLYETLQGQLFSGLGHTRNIAAIPAEFYP
jgi:hypothetical protein